MFNKEELDRIIAKFADAKAEEERKKKEENKEKDEKTKERVAELMQDLKKEWHEFVQQHKTELADIMEVSKGVHKYINKYFDFNFNYGINYSYPNMNLFIGRIGKKCVRRDGVAWQVNSLKTFMNVEREEKGIYDALTRISDIEDGDYFIAKNSDVYILFPVNNIEDNLLVFDEEIYPFSTYLNLTENLNKYELMDIKDNPSEDEWRLGNLLGFIETLSDLFNTYKQELDEFIKKSEKKFDKEEEKNKKLEEKRKEAKRLEDELKQQLEEIQQMENAQDE